MRDKICLAAFVAFVLQLQAAVAQKINVLLITESASQDMNTEFKDGLTAAEADLASTTGDTFDYVSISFDRKMSDRVHTDMCSQLLQGQFSAVVDLTWGGWIKGRKTANQLGLPYIRLQAENHIFVQAADDFLRSQKAVDSALIFGNQVRY